MPRLRPAPARPQGQVAWVSHDSQVLADNPWGDPAERRFPVYLPPGYDPDGPAYLSLWDLAAFTNAGPGHVAWRSHGESLPQRLDRLIADGALPPVIVPMPDAYTSLGGNQYLNSPAVGRYADYLHDELLPFVDGAFNTCPHRAARGVFGKSSGGYGALVSAMLRPDCWAAVASHAGDVGFDRVYLPDFAVAARQLAHFDFDQHAFIEDFWRQHRPRGEAFMAMMVLALAATYDPPEAPESPPRLQLPFDTRTLRLDDERWRRWLRWDPLNLVGEHRDALQSLAALWIDVGRSDQYRIQFGTRELHDRLERLDVRHHFEEFKGTHSGIDWRLDHSLPHLARALLAACRQQDIDIAA